MRVDSNGGLLGWAGFDKVAVNYFRDKLASVHMQRIVVKPKLFFFNEECK